MSSSGNEGAVGRVTTNLEKDGGKRATDKTAEISHRDEEVNQANRQDEEDQEIIVEQPLSTIKEVFVYRVPPLRASSGHRAEEWGLENPVFTGVLKMVQVGNSCCLRLYRPAPEGQLGAVPELFAQCEVRLGNGRTVQFYVESVIDSSRYFVLRCEDKASGRHAFVGIGFRERSSAFDLKAVLDEFVRFIDRQNRAAENAALESQKAAASEGDEEAHGGSNVASVVAQTKDLSIAEGQKLHLDLKVGSAEGSARARRRPRDTGNGLGSGGAGGGQIGLLAPPPLPGSTYRGAGTASRTADVDHQSVVPPPSIGAPNEGRAGVGESLREEGLERDGSGDRGAPPGGSVTGVDGEDEGGEKDEEEDAWGEFESA